MECLFADRPRREQRNCRGSTSWSSCLWFIRCLQSGDSIREKMWCPLERKSTTNPSLRKTSHGCINLAKRCSLEFSWELHYVRVGDGGEGGEGGWSGDLLIANGDDLENLSPSEMHDVEECCSGKRARLITDVWVEHLRRSFLLHRGDGHLLTNSVEHLITLPTQDRCPRASLR